ncbi:hypothetical protein KPL74_01965 [Bacillus sp. NP157]|nr:hypothetical protein KPL74_01965 [Bacillus sp. NP157]
MDIGVFSVKQLGNNEIGELIAGKQSFVLEDVSRLNMPETVATLEKLIEDAGLRSRVYTKGRAASMAAAAIPNPVTIAGGLVAGIGIGVHNLATFNPDYEIAKNLATGTLTVTYKKS